MTVYFIGALCKSKIYILCAYIVMKLEINVTKSTKCIHVVEGESLFYIHNIILNVMTFFDMDGK